MGTKRCLRRDPGAQPCSKGTPGCDVKHYPTPGRKRWLVPVRLVEKNRTAIVEAETKAEAIRKTRAADWEELMDADQFDIIIRRDEPIREDTER